MKQLSILKWISQNIILWTWIIMYIVATIHTGNQTIRIQQSESLCEYLLIGGGAQELIYLTVFVIFSLRIYSSLSRNINGVSHMIDLCCLIQILHCSLCMYPTTHEPSTGVTARSNYVIISIYLPHDPGRKMKRNHETLKQLIANN